MRLRRAQAQDEERAAIIKDLHQDHTSSSSTGPEHEPDFKTRRLSSDGPGDNYDGENDDQHMEDAIILKFSPPPSVPSPGAASPTSVSSFTAKQSSGDQTHRSHHAPRNLGVRRESGSTPGGKSSSLARSPSGTSLDSATTTSRPGSRSATSVFSTLTNGRESREKEMTGKRDEGMSSGGGRGERQPTNHHQSETVMPRSHHHQSLIPLSLKNGHSFQRPNGGISSRNHNHSGSPQNHGSGTGHKGHHNAAIRDQGKGSGPSNSPTIIPAGSSLTLEHVNGIGALKMYPNFRKYKKNILFFVGIAQPHILPTPIRIAYAFLLTCYN